MAEISRRQFFKAAGAATALTILSAREGARALAANLDNETQAAERSGNILHFSALKDFHYYLRNEDAKYGIDPLTQRRGEVIAKRDAAFGDDVTKKIRLIYSESSWKQIGRVKGYLDNPYLWGTRHLEILNIMLEQVGLDFFAATQQPTVILPDRECTEWKVEFLKTEGNALKEDWRINNFGSGRIAQTPMDDLWWIFPSAAKGYPLNTAWLNTAGGSIIDGGLLHEWIHDLFAAPDYYHQIVEGEIKKKFKNYFPQEIFAYSDDIMSIPSTLRISPQLADFIRKEHELFPNWRSTQSDGLLPKDLNFSFSESVNFTFKGPGQKSYLPSDAFFYYTAPEPDVHPFNPLYAGDKKQVILNLNVERFDAELVIFKVGNVNLPVPRSLLNSVAFHFPKSAQLEINFLLDPENINSANYSRLKIGSTTEKTFEKNAQKPVLAVCKVPGTNYLNYWTIE